MNGMNSERGQSLAAKHSCDAYQFRAADRFLFNCARGCLVPMLDPEIAKSSRRASSSFAGATNRPPSFDFERSQFRSQRQTCSTQSHKRTKQHMNTFTKRCYKREMIDCALLVWHGSTMGALTIFIQLRLFKIHHMHATWLGCTLLRRRKPSKGPQPFHVRR